MAHSCHVAAHPAKVISRLSAVYWVSILCCLGYNWGMVMPLLPTNIGPMKMLLMSGWVKQVRRLLPLMKSAIDRLPPMSAWPPLLSLHFQFSTNSSPSHDLCVDIIDGSPLRRGFHASHPMDPTPHPVFKKNNNRTQMLRKIYLPQVIDWTLVFCCSCNNAIGVIVKFFQAFLLAITSNTWQNIYMHF